MATKTTFDLETYDVTTGERLMSYADVEGDDLDDACDYLADELRTYPKYLPPNRELGSWGVRAAHVLLLVSEPVDRTIRTVRVNTDINPGDREDVLASMPARVPAGALPVGNAYVDGMYVCQDYAMAPRVSTTVERGSRNSSFPGSLVLKAAGNELDVVTAVDAYPHVHAAPFRAGFYRIAAHPGTHDDQRRAAKAAILTAAREARVKGLITRLEYTTVRSLCRRPDPRRREYVW